MTDALRWYVLMSALLPKLDGTVLKAAVPVRVRKEWQMKEI